MQVARFIDNSTGWSAPYSACPGANPRHPGAFLVAMKHGHVHFGMQPAHGDRDLTQHNSPKLLQNTPKSLTTSRVVEYFGEAAHLLDKYDSKLGDINTCIGLSTEIFDHDQCK